MNAPLISDPETAAKKAGMCPERLSRIVPFFQTYVDNKKLAGVSTLVWRKGELAHFGVQGQMDVARGRAMAQDTIFRIYSMSKPITSVAVMMLYEEGRFQLEHEIGRYIPELGDLKVYAGGPARGMVTKAASRQVTIRDLLTHMAGFTYGFMEVHPVDEAYRHFQIGGVDLTTADLEEFCKRLGRMPLLHNPGEAWSYSVSTDVLGRLVEVVSGLSLIEFFRTRIFAPLGMTDTDFQVSAEQMPRFAANYQRNPKTRSFDLFDDPETGRYAKPPVFMSGGGGLVSTQADYLKFCQMMLRGGTAPDGTRLLSRPTIALMTQNHLPDGRDLEGFAQGAFSETTNAGIGFGLGFAVTVDEAKAQITGPNGTYYWGGAASTIFWIDPVEEMIAILMTQLMPSGAYPLRRQFQQLVYAAIDD
ncbi:serine hydrolase domain-containing protein [Pyruvatibacter mobilis]|uniref:serine hydrolase domain-containing protein n=1 Tax=Pyruvatibacter mobilis TaxID=1712261 RepID=UPI00145229FF|nr:serine hydrolase domain-containing protein [Pyruvatibacter mobilis]QJD75591.1 beta-lactamase family protein [Pyruvatibacter mobilis]GGD16869.1 serine hydrolase [Pyruvatibacter mobilis]